jgi:hypothetical protein
MSLAGSQIARTADEGPHGKNLCLDASAFDCGDRCVARGTLLPRNGDRRFECEPYYPWRWPLLAFRFEPPHYNSRMVGKPSLTRLGKSCPSPARNPLRLQNIIGSLLRINVLDFPSNSAAMSAAYSHFLVGVPLRSACRHASRL